MKRTALLVALLALPGCLTECGAVGHGVIGRGAVSDGAISGGAVGGRPTASGCPALPDENLIVFDVDAENPGASNLPKDNGPQDLGTFTAVDAPTYTAATGGVPAYWSYDGTDDAHTLTASGVDADDDAAMLMLVRVPSGVPADNDLVSFPGFAPWFRSTSTELCWETCGSRDVTHAGTDTWLLLLATKSGSAASNSDAIYELVAGNTATFTLRHRFDLNGAGLDIGRVSTRYGEADIARIVVWENLSDPNAASFRASISAWASCTYPNAY